MVNFAVSSETRGDVAKIRLSGDLDSSSAMLFKDAIEKLAPVSPKTLVLFMRDLTFMASAGLRILIFAKQKLGDQVNIYIVQPQEQILDTLQKTGFDQSVYIVDDDPM